MHLILLIFRLNIESIFSARTLAHNHSYLFASIVDTALFSALFDCFAINIHSNCSQHGLRNFSVISFLWGFVSRQCEMPRIRLSACCTFFFNSYQINSYFAIANKSQRVGNDCDKMANAFKKKTVCGAENKWQNGFFCSAKYDTYTKTDCEGWWR